MSRPAPPALEEDVSGDQSDSDSDLEVFYTAAFKALYNSVAWAPTLVTTVSKRFEVL